LWNHQFIGFEFFESLIGIFVNSLGPSVFSHIVVSDFDKWLWKDFKSIVRFGVFSAFELRVDLFGCCFREESLPIEEVSVLDVEMNVGLAKCNQTYDEEDF
jgi:hypothetical protein